MGIPLQLVPSAIDWMYSIIRFHWKCSSLLHFYFCILFVSIKVCNLCLHILRFLPTSLFCAIQNRKTTIFFCCVCCSLCHLKAVTAIIFQRCNVSNTIYFKWDRYSMRFSLYIFLSLFLFSFLQFFFVVFIFFQLRPALFPFEIVYVSLNWRRLSCFFIFFLLLFRFTSSILP